MFLTLSIKQTPHFHRRNFFRLLENETMEILSMGERSKSKYKFGGTKVCDADEVIEYFYKF